MGSMQKPLHTPETRHRDRRAGAVTEAFRSALRAPAQPAPRLVRPDRQRVASYRKLAERTRVGNRAAEIGAVGFVLVILVLVLQTLARLP